MSVKHTTIPIYRGSLIVLLTNDVEEVKKYCPEFSKQDIYAHAVNASFDGIDGYFIILNPKSEYRQLTHGVIAHEVLHVVNMISINRGIECDLNNDEPIAYLTEWVCDFVYSALHDAKKMNCIKHVSI